MTKPIACVVTIACTFWFCLAQLPARAAEPTAEDYQQQAQRCRELLRSSVVDFYLPHCVDREHGGYLEELDRPGRFQNGPRKFLTLQARQLWFFSTLATADIRREEALGAARSGFDFLRKNFHDREHGGYFSTVTPAGQPLDRRKHAYLNSFALYGLVAYHQATGDQAALQAAQELFRTLDQHAYDRRHGGYQEFFHEDWRPVTDPSEQGYVGAINSKTYNTHLHLLESFATLYRNWPDPTVERRLAELIQINTTTVKHPDHACNIDGWHRDWQMIDDPRNLRASYGHDVECAWLTIDAARALGWSPDLLRQWAEALCHYSMRHGYDEQHGGFYYTGPVGQPADDLRKEWWVEAEALVAMLEMARLTGEPRYYDAFLQTLDFVEQHQVAEQGSWWSSLEPDGRPLPGASRSSMWHGAYHNGRALLISAQLLDELAKREGKGDRGSN